MVYREFPINRTIGFKFDDSQANVFAKVLKTLQYGGRSNYFDHVTYAKKPDKNDPFYRIQFNFSSKLPIPGDDHDERIPFYLDAGYLQKTSPTSCRAVIPKFYVHEQNLPVEQPQTALGATITIDDPKHYTEVADKAQHFVMKDSVCGICGKRDGRRRVLHLAIKHNNRQKSVVFFCEKCYQEYLNGTGLVPLVSPNTLSIVEDYINKIMELYNYAQDRFYMNEMVYNVDFLSGKFDRPLN